jgi:hypothetical protein
LKNKELVDRNLGWGDTKKGAPRSAGIYHDVVENKRRLKSTLESTTMLLKTHKLAVSCHDFDEKKGSCMFWGLGTRGWRTVDR